MSSRPDFLDVVRDTGEAIEHAGDEIQQPHTINHNGNEVRCGFRAKRDGHLYDVIGDPDKEFFTVSFPYSIVGDFSDLFDESQAHDFINEYDAEEFNGPVQELALIELLDSINPQIALEFRSGLLDTIKQQDTNCIIHTIGRRAVEGFEVYMNYFPYEDGISTGQLNSNIQQVCNAGSSGMRYVSHAFDLESVVQSEVGNQNETELQSPRYLQ